MTRTPKRRSTGKEQDNIPSPNKAYSKVPSRKHVENLPHNRPTPPEPEVLPPQDIVLSVPNMPPALPWQDNRTPDHVLFGLDPDAVEALRATQPPKLDGRTTQAKALKLIPPLPAPTEKELGIVEGMVASGATEVAVRRRLRWTRDKWRNMLAQHPILKNTLSDAKGDDAQACLHALRRAALTPAGTMRKHKGALRAMQMYLAMAHKMGLTNNNQFNQFNTLLDQRQQTGVLRVNVSVGQTPEQLEAEAAEQQDRLQTMAQLVRLPKDITPED